MIPHASILVHVQRILAAALFAFVASNACGSPAPQPPTVSPPSSDEPILGTERLGWDQRAADNGEFAALRYAIYVDGARTELSGVTCADAATEMGFPCSAPLPRLTIGSHTLELATFTQDGGVLESARSAALRVTVAAQTPTSSNPVTTTSARGAAAVTAWPSAAVQLVAGLERPADLAVLPDGRILVAERTGLVRVVRGGSIAPSPALTLEADVRNGDAVLALAVDPQFARTHFVYAIYTSRSQNGASSFTLARFREASDTLADRVVLLDDIRASAEPHASLRFGPDGKLYAAFDDGGDPQRASDPSSMNGKMLRLNPDGTTPSDQPRGSPVLSSGFASPRGLDWHRASNRLWAADLTRVGAVRWTTPPSAIAATADDLFIASEAGLRRARFERRNPDRLSDMTDLLKGLAIEAVAVAPDGSIVFATAHALGRLP
jgi:hypothetical protein